MAETAQYTQQQQEAVQRLTMLAEALDVDVPDDITPEFAEALQSTVDAKIKAIDPDGDGHVMRISLRSSAIGRAHMVLADDLVEDQFFSMEDDKKEAALSKALDSMQGDVKLVLGDAAPVIAKAAPSGVEKTAAPASGAAPTEKGEAAAFEPDAKTQAAMDYICSDVFPGLGLSANSKDVASFQGCYEKAILSLKDLASLSDDPSKHAGELKLKLDEMAKNPDFVQLRSDYESAKNSTVAQLTFVTKITLAGYGDKIPEAMKDNPELLFSLIDNRDKIVESVATVSSGVLSVPTRAASTGAEASAESTATGSEASSKGAETGVEASAESAATGAKSSTKIVEGSLKPDDPKVQAAANVVEDMFLKPMGDYISKMGDKAAEYSAKFADFKPLTEEEINDGVLAQEQLRTALIGFKILDDQKNPSGAYDPSQKEAMIKSIMEKPKFDMVRQQIDAKISAGETDPAVIADKRKVMLDELFTQMDVLYRAGLTNSEKAKNDTVYNRVLMQAAEWIPEGMKGFLKDFFTGKGPMGQWGEMLGNFLGAMGIQVSLLWGEELKSEVDLVAESAPNIEKNFKAQFEEAEGADPLEKLQAMEKEALENADSFGSRFAQNLIFKGANKDFVDNTIKSAFDKAEEAARKPGATDETIAQAFTNEVITRAQEFRENPENAKKFDDLTEKEKYETIEDVKVKVDKGVAEFKALGFDTENGHDIGIKYTEREFDSVVERYAYDAPAAIYGVIDRNFEALGLVQDQGMIKDGGGALKTVFDPQGNAMIEELLIRAQIHSHLESGGELNEAYLAALNEKNEHGTNQLRELSVDNVSLVEDYLRHQGVGDADIKIFHDSIQGMGENFYGTDSAKPDAGEAQTDSVLEHVVYGGQLDTSLLVPAPEPEPEPDLVSEKPKSVDLTAEEKPEVDAAPKPDNSCKPEGCRQAFEKVAGPTMSHANDAKPSGDVHYYRDLPLFKLDSVEASYLRGKLVENVPGLAALAEERGQDPINVFLMEKMNRGGNQFVAFDFNEMGIAAYGHMDGVMVYRPKGGDTLPELRYYDTLDGPESERTGGSHNIKSFSYHRELGDYGRSMNPISGQPRDFDTFMSRIDRSSGSALEQSPSSTSGFKGIAVVGSDYDLHNAFDLVYGNVGVRGAIVYRDSYSHRASNYSNALNGSYVASKGGKPEEYASNSERHNKRSDAGDSSEAKGEFNKSSGARCERPEYREPKGSQIWIEIFGRSRIIKDKLNQIGCDESDNDQASIDLEHGIQDMGADQFDPTLGDDNFIPGMQSTSTMSVAGRTA